MSRPLRIAEGVAAVLLLPDINTDIIAPTQRRMAGEPLPSTANGAALLFGPWRYHRAGAERADFVLNRPPFREARFLIAGPNFGCGSSRESAAAWLRDFGICCVMAESFGGIFFDNCCRNGILPLQLPAATIADLAQQAISGGIFRLDLAASALATPQGAALPVSLAAYRRRLLMSGSDEIAMTEERRAEILSFQAQLRIDRPWTWPSVEDAATRGE